MTDKMATGLGAGAASRANERADDEKTTLDQAYHFGMYTMKAVLDGRATELIDLAKVNLTR